jgi:hypothetical protein
MIEHLGKYTISQLKKIIRENNHIFHIKLTQKKEGLINDLIKHLDYDEPPEKTKPIPKPIPKPSKVIPPEKPKPSKVIPPEKTKQIL